MEPLRNTSAIPRQPNLMVDSKITRYALLFTFVALTAGGPALHYAPIFGLHECEDHLASHDHANHDDHCGHTHWGHTHWGHTHRPIKRSIEASSDNHELASSSSCDCGSEHEQDESNAQTWAASSLNDVPGLVSDSNDENKGHTCHGSCSVCQFFSSISFHTATFSSAPFDELSYSFFVVSAASLSHPPKHSYFERGPPAFMPIA